MDVGLLESGVVRNYAIGPNLFEAGGWTCFVPADRKRDQRDTVAVRSGGAFA